MLLSTILLLAVANEAIAQSVSTFPQHHFTIRSPEPCDQSCRDTICTTEGYCTDCGSGLCIGQEECGTWAGKENYCCIQPYNFGTGDRLRCSDASSFLQSVDLSSSSTDGTQPKKYKAEACPQNEVWAAQTIFGAEESTNLTCCPKGNDVVVLEVDGKLTINEGVLCVAEQSGGGSGGDSSNSENSDSNGGSGTNSGVRTDIRILPIVFLLLVPFMF